MLQLYKNLHAGYGHFYYRGQRVDSREVPLWLGNCFEHKIMPMLLTLVAPFYTSIRGLDYGCGKAMYVPRLYQAMGGKLQEWYLFDPACKPYMRCSQGQFDVVTCADVLEHVYDFDSELISMNALLRDTGTAIFSISGKPDSRSFANGLNMHVTLKSFEEWQEILSYHFGDKRVILLYNNTQYWESRSATVRI